MKSSRRRWSVTRLALIGVAGAVVLGLLVVVALAMAIFPISRESSTEGSTARDAQVVLGAPVAKRGAIEIEDFAPAPATADAVVVERAVEAEMVAEASPPQGAGQKAPAPGVVDRKIVRNATLEMIVAQIAVALDRIDAVVSGISGAYVADSDVKDQDSRLPSRVVLRVPSASFQQAVADLKALAVEVLDERIGTRDVTEQFTDLSSQLRNLRATEDQFLALLERADKVEDIVQIQDRLSRVRGDIELLQGRLNLLENQVDLSTVTAILHAPPDLTIELLPQGVPASGHSFTTVIEYGNEGSVRARDVVIRLSVPDGLRFETTSSGGKYDSSARSVTWELGEVAPGVNGRVTAAFLAQPGGRALSPVAFIESSTAEKKPENDTDQVKIDFVPDLTVDLFGPSSLAEGSHGDLFLRLENRGTGDAEDVTATLAVPAGTTFVSADGGGAYDESGKEIVWKVGRLAPNRSEDFAATIRVDVPEGRLAFEASVMSTIEDASERDNASSLSITAIEEDVSERDVWRPGGTLSNSVEALGSFAQALVDALIWIATFAVPLAVVVAVIAIPVILVRRRRANR